jgi:hypothetical protein
MPQMPLQKQHLQFLYPDIPSVVVQYKLLLTKPSNKIEVKGKMFYISCVFSESLNSVVGQTVSVQL